MRIVLLIIVVFITSAIKAQPYFDVLNVNYAQESAKGLESGDDLPQISNDWLFVNLNLPWQINKNNVLILSPSLEQRTYKTIKLEDKEGYSPPSKFGFSEGEKVTYQTLYFPLSLQHTFKDSVNKILGCVIYRFNRISTFKLGSGNDMLGGAFIFTHEVTKKFSWSGGVYYNKEFFGNYFTPLVGIDWQPTERLFIFGLLPNIFTVDYCITPAIHGGVNFRGVEESYSIQNDNSYFLLDEGQLRLFTDIYVTHTGIVFTAEAGLTGLKDFKFQYEPKSDYQKTTVTQGFGRYVLRVGINYRIMTNSAFRTPQK